MKLGNSDWISSAERGRVGMMSLMQTQRLMAGALFFGLLFSPRTVFAQQTIFNVPSADVTPPGQLYLEHESQFRPWHRGRFWAGTHYAALGMGHHTELDTTLLNVSSPTSDNITLAVGFKSAFPLLTRQFPEQEFKLTVGELLPVSLQGHGVGNFTYSHLSGRLPKLKTRLTAGVATGTKQIFGRNTVCFIGGYEHPLTKRLSILGDWYSGTHNNGFFIPGFSYAFSPVTALFVGYQIPNARQSGHQAFVLELSKLF